MTSINHLYISFPTIHLYRLVDHPAPPDQTASGYITLRVGEITSRNFVAFTISKSTYPVFRTNRPAVTKTIPFSPPVGVITPHNERNSHRDPASFVLEKIQTLPFQLAGIQSQHTLSWPEVQPCHQDMRGKAESGMQLKLWLDLGAIRGHHNLMCQ